MDAHNQPRVALLGYGYWGPNLARNLHMRLGRDWVACVDPDPARRAEVAHRYPWVRVLADPHEVMADPEVDALVVASPARTHAPLLADAFRAGKHVLVEKPLALSTAEAVALAEAADRARRVLLVGHTFEYNPAVTRMRELLEAGDLGDLWYLHSQRVNLGLIQSNIYSRGQGRHRQGSAQTTRVSTHTCNGWPTAPGRAWPRHPDQLQHLTL